MKKLAVAIALFCLFPAGAMAQTPAAPKPDGRKTLCVIPRIGDRIFVQKIGMTVFGNELATVPAESWGLDARAVSRFASTLKNRFNVKPLPASAALFDPPAKPDIFSNPEEKLRQAVRTTAGSQKCDYAVLLLKHGAGYSSTNQAVTGIGIVTHASLIGATHVHAIYSARVYDGRTFEERKREIAHLDEAPLFNTIYGPHREVDESWFPKTPEAALRDQRLKEALQSLLDKSLALMIPKLFTQD